MKKLIAMLLMLAMTFMFVACGDSDDSEALDGGSAKFETDEEYVEDLIKRYLNAAEKADIEKMASLSSVKVDGETVFFDRNIIDEYDEELAYFDKFQEKYNEAHNENINMDYKQCAIIALLHAVPHHAYSNHTVALHQLSTSYDVYKADTKQPLKIKYDINVIEDCLSDDNSKERYSDKFSISPKKLVETMLATDAEKVFFVVADLRYNVYGVNAEEKDRVDTAYFICYKYKGEWKLLDPQYHDFTTEYNYTIMETVK